MAIQLRHGSLFSGIGGFDLAAEWCGWKNVFHCEVNEFCNRVLGHHWPEAESIKNIVGYDWNRWRGKVDVREITGFALYSDDSALSISAVLNTRSHLREVRAEEPGHDLYFRWSPGEWKYQMLNAEAFDSLNALLLAAHDGLPQSAFAGHRNAVYSCAAQVLGELKTEGLFDGMPPDFVLQFAASDFEDLEVEVAWAKRLNAVTASEEFEAFIHAEER